MVVVIDLVLLLLSASDVTRIAPRPDLRPHKKCLMQNVVAAPKIDRNCHVKNKFYIVCRSGPNVSVRGPGRSGPVAYVVVHVRKVQISAAVWCERLALVSFWSTELSSN